MPAFEEHCRDCEYLLGDRCEAVNRWMDGKTRTHGQQGHRRVRHHREGAAEAGALFGKLGEQAALVHVLKDCGHIPNAEDYGTGRVDNLGMKGVFNGY